MITIDAYGRPITGPLPFPLPLPVVCLLDEYRWAVGIRIELTVGILSGIDRIFVDLHARQPHLTDHDREAFWALGFRRKIYCGIDCGSLQSTYPSSYQFQRHTVNCLEQWTLCLDRLSSYHTKAEQLP